MGIVGMDTKELENLFSQRRRVFGEILDDDSVSTYEKEDVIRDSKFLKTNSLAIRDVLFDGGVTKEKEQIVLDNVDTLFFSKLINPWNGNGEYATQLFYLLLNDGNDFFNILDFGDDNFQASKDLLIKITESAFFKILNEPQDVSPNSDFFNFFSFVEGKFSSLMDSENIQPNQEKKKQEIADAFLKSATCTMWLANCFNTKTIVNKNSSLINQLNQVSKEKYGMPLGIYLQKKVGCDFMGGWSLDAFLLFDNNDLQNYMDNRSRLAYETKRFQEYSGSEDLAGGLVKVYLSKDGLSKYERDAYFSKILFNALSSPNFFSALFEVDFYNQKSHRDGVKDIRGILGKEKYNHTNSPIKRYVDGIKNGDINSIYAMSGYSPLLSGFEPVRIETLGARLFGDIQGTWQLFAQKLLKKQSLKSWGIDNATLKQHGLPTIEEYFITHPLPFSEENKKILKTLIGDKIFEKINQVHLNENDSLSLLKDIKESGRTFFQSMLKNSFLLQESRIGLKNLLYLLTVETFEPEHANNVWMRWLVTSKQHKDRLLKLDLSSKKVVQELKNQFVSKEYGPSAIERFWTSITMATENREAVFRNPRINVDFDLLFKVIVPATQEELKNSPQSNISLQRLLGINPNNAKNEEVITSVLKERLLSGFQNMLGNTHDTKIEYGFSQLHVTNKVSEARIRRLPSI